MINRACDKKVAAAKKLYDAHKAAAAKVRDEAKLPLHVAALLNRHSPTTRGVATVAAIAIT
jgi:hypothetical protein